MNRIVAVVLAVLVAVGLGEFALWRSAENRATDAEAALKTAKGRTTPSAMTSNQPKPR